MVHVELARDRIAPNAKAGIGWWRQGGFEARRDTRFRWFWRRQRLGRWRLDPDRSPMQSGALERGYGANDNLALVKPSAPCASHSPEVPLRQDLLRGVGFGAFGRYFDAPLCFVHAIDTASTALVSNTSLASRPLQFSHIPDIL